MLKIVEDADYTKFKALYPQRYFKIDVEIEDVSECIVKYENGETYTVGINEPKHYMRFVIKRLGDFFRNIRITTNNPRNIKGMFITTDETVIYSDDEKFIGPSEWFPHYLAPYTNICVYIQVREIDNNIQVQYESGKLSKPLTNYQDVYVYIKGYSCILQNGINLCKYKPKRSGFVILDDVLQVEKLESIRLKRTVCDRILLSNIGNAHSNLTVTTTTPCMVTVRVGADARLVTPFGHRMNIQLYAGSVFHLAYQEIALEITPPNTEIDIEYTVYNVDADHPIYKITEEIVMPALNIVADKELYLLK